MPRPFRQPRQHDYGLGPKSRKNESGLTQGPLSATSLGGPLNKKLRTPTPWRTLCAADLHFWSRPLLWANFTCRAACSCGAGFLACGRLSSRPWCPLPSALSTANPPPPVEHAAKLATPAVLVEQATTLATPASPWSTQSCALRLNASQQVGCSNRPSAPSAAASLQPPLPTPLSSCSVFLHFHPADHPKPPKVISLAFTSRCNARKGCEPTRYP